MSNYLDIVIVILVILGFLLGLKDGFIKKILSLAALAVAIIISITFSNNVKLFIQSLIQIDPFPAMIISFILIFVLSFLVASIISKMFTPKDVVLNFINRILGGLLGFLQVGLILSALLIFLNIFHFPNEEVKRDSHFYKLTYNLIPLTFKFVEKTFPSSKEFFDLIREANKRKESIFVDV